MDTTHPVALAREAISHLTAVTTQYDDTDRGALIDALHNLTIAWSLLSMAEDGVVLALRQRRATWAEIGEALGVSRSAAQQRFRHIEP